MKVADLKRHVVIWAPNRGTIIPKSGDKKLIKAGEVGRKVIIILKHGIDLNVFVFEKNGESIESG